MAKWGKNALHYSQVGLIPRFGSACDSMHTSMDPLQEQHGVVLLISRTRRDHLRCIRSPIASSMSTTTVGIETAPQNPPDVELHPIQESPGRTVHVDANHEHMLNKKNIARILAIGFSFLFAGLNDGSLGALTPYIIRTYHVGTEMVALM